MRQKSIFFSIVVAALAAPAQTIPSKSAGAQSSAVQEAGWPRLKTSPQGKLVYYQPQFDDWKGFKTLHGRMAVSVTPTGGQPVLGVAEFAIETEADLATHTVLLYNPQFLETRFPSADPPTADQIDTLVRSFLPPETTLTISLERVIASTDKPKSNPVQGLKNDPPPIFVSYVPALILIVDGPPVPSAIPKTDLAFIVNSNWPLFSYEKDKFYLLSGTQWLEAKELNGPWKKTDKIPGDFKKLPDDPSWADVKKAVPAKKSSEPAPQVFSSQVPAELLLFKGPPIYAKVPGTTLSYASNTERDVFIDGATKMTYILLGGRWFRSSSLQGPWTFASGNLPGEFQQIPDSSAASRVLSSVPGTPEAEDAVLLAQVPQAVTVMKDAASKIMVTYAGMPEFRPIEGTQLQYAVNTQDKVIKLGEQYYLCFQGIWFIASSPNGPWKTAESIPKEIYTIPPSSPVHNVTYVTQQVTSDGEIEAAYTAGYLGMYVGTTIYWGSGWYYPPYYYPGIYPIYYGYPYTYGAAVGYNPYTGRYGAGGAIYGPYGGAGWGATYNPSTGTYARGATAYGPNGSRTVAQAYNPYTGTYAATRQGSSPYAQWGSSVVTRGNQSAVTGHVTTGAGTVGGIRTSNGGGAVAKTGPGGDAFAGRTASGDVYAGKDGNVYRRSSDGSWQKYDNGSWNGADKPTPKQQGQTARTQDRSAQTQSLNQEWQNRQRGQAETQRVQQGDRSNWSGRSGGYSRGGGGRRR